MSAQPSSSSDVLSQYSHLELEGNNVGYAMEMLAKADAVCFDVDSTVIDEEGIVSTCARMPFLRSSSTSKLTCLPIK